MNKNVFLVSLTLFTIVSFSVLRSESGYMYLENGILDYAEDSSRSGSTSESSHSHPGVQPKKSVFFSVPKGQTLKFKIAPSYNVVERIYLENRGENSVSIKVSSKADRNLLVGITGAGGDSFLTLPAKKKLSLPIRFFAQDSPPGFYNLENSVFDEQGNVLSTIQGLVEVLKPNLDISVDILEKTPLTHSYRIKNNGEDLANFSMSLKNSKTLRLEPSVNHYFFPKGGFIDVSLYATGAIDGEIRDSFLFSSSNIEKAIPFVFQAHAPGSVEMVSLDPIVRLRQKDWYCTNRPVISMDYSIPYFEKRETSDLGFTSKFSWLISKGESSDTNGNGKPDQWILIENGSTLMVGDDYDEDGEIDYFRERDNENRTLNRAYFKKDSRWYETNIVDAYLVSSYLPFNDGANVRPHELEVQLNGKSFAQEKGIVPTGSRLRKIPLHLLNDNQFYGYSENRVTLITKHLPEAHYQVNAENTLLLFYSSIQIPVVNPKKKLDSNISGISEKIREEEKKISEEPNEIKKEAIRNLLEKLKLSRDNKLKEVENFFRENPQEDASLKTTGVQYRGTDLAVFSSDLSLNGKKISGTARNMGYESVPYTLSVYKLNDQKYVLIEKRSFSNLPPFAQRNFSFEVKDHSKTQRTVYKIEIAPNEKRIQELVTSNNQAHWISGTETDPLKLKKEMAELAKEMGLVNDQVTLTSKPALPEFSVTEFDNLSGKRIVFPKRTKDKEMNQKERRTILE
ncbi:hypothetical protein EHQ12_17050 [Leptospira gomenensis]|uniref:Uncharacterized protein n=1 Tax=Leptospira gomenensis TaxID=2484974 RepID=A0A5F1YED6_9LEPT|nr:hypothetical protein [Leptospira gomenensis]TGK33789.1 hypothetical protein EHQ12_17050 [Leptospira gomenensis]TGK36358.1 hypothetical protein EHQ17_04205 [Leptospira gomenensis]TGK47382.1 hypothetical protein EHQ07_05955 [Leptospira gomenensis]TGK60669.1 hypothetical protein EHQ13_10935 [Leptospira gomenensis]